MTRRALLVVGFLVWLMGPALADVADRQAALRRGVVLILQQEAQGLRQGTAFVVAREGRVSWLVTCQHVVGTDGTAGAWIEGHREPVLLEVVGLDPKADLALLRARDLRVAPLPLAAPGSIRIGRSLGVIGYPRVDAFVAGGMEVTPSIRRGIVSAVRDRAGVPLIQTDASINPGDSGGPAVDWENGRVVGVASAQLPQGSGLNLLVAVDAVHSLLRAHGVRVGTVPEPGAERRVRPRPRPSPTLPRGTTRPIPPPIVMLGLIGVLAALGAGLVAVLRGGPTEPPDPGPSM